MDTHQKMTRAAQFVCSGGRPQSTVLPLLTVVFGMLGAAVDSFAQETQPVLAHLARVQIMLDRDKVDWGEFSGKWHTGAVTGGSRHCISIALDSITFTDLFPGIALDSITFTDLFPGDPGSGADGSNGDHHHHGYGHHGSNSGSSVPVLAVPLELISRIRVSSLYDGRFVQGEVTTVWSEHAPVDGEEWIEIPIESVKNDPSSCPAHLK
jgi:hypothetical protein